MGSSGFESCVNNSCLHKELLPMNQLEFWGMIVTFLILWITNIGGMGGGGMVVPISLLFFQFDAKNAVTVSNFSSFISSA